MSTVCTSSAMDPLHFGTNSDPQIRTTDLQIRIAFSISVLQDTNKKKFFKKCFCFLLFEDTFTSVFIDKNRVPDPDPHGSALI
jgi:hypothetical protein